MFNEGSNEMSGHLDKVLEHGVKKGMNDSEAAFFALTQFLAFLADPDNLEKAFLEDPAVAAVGVINMVRWAYEWSYVKQSAWNLPNTVGELTP